MRTFTKHLICFGIVPLTAGLPLLVRQPTSSSRNLPSPVNTSKFVFAHHIIGNTFNFTSAAWSSDVSLAHASGIDGFALNVGNQPWEPDQVHSAYDAAHISGTGFKMFLSLDMSSLPCTSESDAQIIISLIRSQASHPSQFKYGPRNRTFVSTFAGEKCTFSAASSSEGWAQHVLAPLASEVHFVPAFFVDPSQLSSGNTQGKGGFGEVIDGDFNWNSGWPTQLTTSALTESASNPSALASLLNLNISSSNFSGNPFPSTPDAPSALLPNIVGRSALVSLKGLASAFKSPGSVSDAARAAFSGVAGAFTSDRQHLSAIQNGNSRGVSPGVVNVGGASVGVTGPVPKKTYMAAVSPWFFTHFSPQSFNKNFIFLSDNHLYSKRWEQLITSRDEVDLVEIATWNDYGESHYIGPIEGTQPNSQAWVNGNDHVGWLDLTAYYAQAFKSGITPIVEKDKVVMWARTHPRDAQANEDTVGKPTNFQLTEDSLWATVFVPSPSDVTLSTSPHPISGTPTSTGNSQTFKVPAGVSHLKVPLTPGGSMRASVSRDGKTVLDFVPEGYTFESNPKTFNFNAFVAASP